MPKPYEAYITNKDEWATVWQLGKEMILTHKKSFKITMTSEDKRSGTQNSFIHAVFEDIASQMYARKNKPAEYWKNYCKEKLGKKVVHFDLDEKPFIEVVSTTKYSKADMSDFFTKIQAHFMQEFNVNIKDPNE